MESPCNASSQSGTGISRRSAKTLAGNSLHSAFDKQMKHLRVLHENSSKHLPLTFFASVFTERRFDNTSEVCRRVKLAERCNEVSVIVLLIWFLGLWQL